ncbi:MAG: aldose 1-epimerase [Pseudomonadota bacterium]
MIRLERDDFTLAVAPKFGGSVMSFTRSGKDILRPASEMGETNWDTRNTAGFPMLPFVGRITDGRFKIGKHDVQLPANMPPEPHAIHGFGWQTGWTVENKTKSTLTLSLGYTATESLWTFKARQIFVLTDTGLSIQLEIQNTAEIRLPFGFGWHPYFPKAGATLQAPVTQSWTGENTRPERAELTDATDLRTKRSVEELNLDTAFDCEPNPVLIATGDHNITLESDPIFSKLTVYTPPNEDYFCVEPITHTPDAINMALSDTTTGLKWLRPAETLSGKMTLSVKPV